MILWGTEHELRASNLAAAYQENVLALGRLAVPGAPLPASADKTLTIWGHGGPDDFAGMDASVLANFIKAWKNKNPALLTVELVTCDARHATDDRDSFTDQLMPLLINSTVGKVLVNVKTLPRGGSSATTSELYATEVKGSDGYYFIAADTAAALQAGVKVFKDAYAQVPANTAVSAMYKAAIPLAKAANDKAAMRGALHYVSSGGLFPALRGMLVNVTVYVVGTQRMAVPKVLG